MIATEDVADGSQEEPRRLERLAWHGPLRIIPEALVHVGDERAEHARAELPREAPVRGERRPREPHARRSQREADPVLVGPPRQEGDPQPAAEQERQATPHQTAVAPPSLEVELRQRVREARLDERPIGVDAAPVLAHQASRASRPTSGVARSSVSAE
jgi:hypothetical protein